MRIRISDSEIYEIKLNDYTEHNKEISAKEFLELMARFENVVKLIKLNSKEQTLDEIKPTKLPKFGRPKMITTSNKTGRIYTPRKKGSRTWCNTKEKTMDVMQYFYHGTKEDRERIEKIAGQSRQLIAKAFYQLRGRWNIKPEEIGVNAFWKAIPNYTIKSYTGEYDE